MHTRGRLGMDHWDCKTAWWAEKGVVDFLEWSATAHTGIVQ